MYKYMIWLQNYNIIFVYTNILQEKYPKMLQKGWREQEIHLTRRGGNHSMVKQDTNFSSISRCVVGNELVAVPFQHLIPPLTPAGRRHLDVFSLPRQEEYTQSVAVVESTDILGPYRPHHSCLVVVDKKARGIRTSAPSPSSRTSASTSSSTHAASRRLLPLAEPSGYGIIF